MTPELEDRIAQALGWSLADVRSFSLPTLRDFVRPVSAKLAHEITLTMQGPDYVRGPVQKPRRGRPGT